MGCLILYTFSLLVGYIVRDATVMKSCHDLLSFNRLKVLELGIPYEQVFKSSPKNPTVPNTRLTGFSIEKSFQVSCYFVSTERSPPLHTNHTHTHLIKP